MIPWCVLSAADAVLVDATRVGVNRKLYSYGDRLWNPWCLLNRNKTEYMRCDFSGVGCDLVSKMPHQKK